MDVPVEFEAKESDVKWVVAKWKKVDSDE